MVRITKEEFEQQKQDSIREWEEIRVALSNDPFYPITGCKINAIGKLKIQHGWKFGCFLCSLFHRNGCIGCPLVSCFDMKSPYIKIVQVQSELDNDDARKIVLENCDAIIDLIKKLTYEEVQNGTLNNSDNTEQL